MLKAQIAVLVSGGGTNLQQLLDAEQDGRLTHGEIVLVISDHADAYALERAEKRHVTTAIVEKKECADQKEFEQRILALLAQKHIDLIVLAGFMFGNMFSILYSLAGGILSFLIMYLLKRYTGLHVISISAAGGISHNIGQLFVAALVVENYNILYYASVLIIAGIITGIMIGIVAQEVILRLKQRIDF